MLIKTRYNINQKLYSISRFNSDYFQIDDVEFIITQIMYTNENEIFYKLSFDNSFTWVEENKIDDIENGYYFTSKELSEKAVTLANNK